MQRHNPGPLQLAVRSLVAASLFSAVAGWLVPGAAAAAVKPAGVMFLTPLVPGAHSQVHFSPLPSRHVPPRTPRQGRVRVVLTSPRSGGTNVGVNSPISIVLSAPPPLEATVPTLEPPVVGQWYLNGRTLTFEPQSGYRPFATENVIVPSSLAAPVKWSFTVGGVPLLRTQQLLAELGYLPFNVDIAKRDPLLGHEPTRAALVPVLPPPATFTWSFPTEPYSLKSLWSPGTDNVITAGAVMNFEETVGLPTDGVVGPAVWQALTAAVAGRHMDKAPYDYLVVSENLPESLVVWQDGRAVYETPVNTGVSGAWTATGTFPVYERFVTTTMSGTDPDGYQYDVSGVPWVAYFNGGDAVHGYWRASYGWPQSNGCVELPVPNAQVVWSMDPIGTLVTVVS
ncbi:MAG TPA: L,D-transpeptidase family protein [Acidimicrobiales bacterium]|nr:L,D-transpeptidase family protein [Acidimicrobiales bacterium]